MDILEQQLLNEPVKEGFKINDLDTANWAFEKIAVIVKKQKEIDDLAEKKIQQIKDWQDAENKIYENDKAGLEYMLTEYYRINKEKDKKFRLSTPLGKVTSRKSGTSIKYKDESKVLEQLKERGLTDFIRIKEEINKKDLSKAFHITESGKVIDVNGEEIEGAYAEEGTTSYSVKVVETE